MSTHKHLVDHSRCYVGTCPDCRTEDLVKAILAPYGFTPEFQGDPRGCVLTIKTPEREICVPS